MELNILLIKSAVVCAKGGGAGQGLSPLTFVGQLGEMSHSVAIGKSHSWTNLREMSRNKLK